MDKISKQIRALTVLDWIAIALFLTYVLVFSWLNIRQFQAFEFGALDLAKFDQGIWSTAQGKPFRITLAEDSVIQSHFSPSLALLSPLYLIWPDIRLLFISQAILNAGAGALIYLLFRRKEQAQLGLIVFAAYLMHPSLHQVNLIGFRRLTIAVFAVSFLIYHLLQRNFAWASLGLFVALLSKEDMAFTAIAAGLYALLAPKAKRWGALFLVVGLAWLILVPFVVLPAMNANADAYSHAAVQIPYLGDSLPEITRNFINSPELPFQYIMQADRLEALWRFFWPTLFLFVLSPEIAFFLLPYLFFYLSSVSDELGELKAWYPSVLLPLLYWAVAVGLDRLRQRVSPPWYRAVSLGLIVASLAAWFLYSQLWPGARFNAARYRVSEHDRRAAERLEEIPQDAIVAAQDSLVPHLSHRDFIYLFPWIKTGVEAEYIVFDRGLESTYPLSEGEYRTFFYDIFAETAYELVEQYDSLYIFRQSEAVGPDLPRPETWSGAFTLLGYSIAVAPPGESFQPVIDVLPANTQVRVTLFWRVEEDIEQNYTVFAHLLAPDGWTLDQHDDWPADRHRPTSDMPPGKVIRDVHYLTLPREMPADELRVRIGVYESLTAVPQLTQAGEESIIVPLRR